MGAWWGLDEYATRNKCLFPVHMPHDLDKTLYLIKWVSSIVALQDHKIF